MTILTDDQAISYGKKPLTSPMEEGFCQAFVNNGYIGRRAAITAGYSKDNADEQAQILKKRPRVMVRISYLCGLKLRQQDLTIDDFTRKIKEHMDFSIKDIFDGDGVELLAVSKLKDSTARCITAIELSADGKTTKYRTEGSMGFTKMLGHYLTVIQETLDRTDAMVLQKKWSDQADELYNKIREDAEARDARPKQEHLPKDTEA